MCDADQTNVKIIILGMIIHQTTSNILSHISINMKTSCLGNIFHITGYLCGESTIHRWIPLVQHQEIALPKNAAFGKETSVQCELKQTFLIIQENMFENMVCKLLAILL